MKVVILCGGLGTRLREETEFRPKPMVMIGDKPILWHIMKTYATQGFDDFVLCLGYKGELIKEYFFHYELMTNDVTLELGSPEKITYHPHHDEVGWKITMANTGKKTLKGGRLKKIQKYIDGDTFMMTYGDGVADIDIKKLLAFHKRHGKLATVTGVNPASRFGVLKTKHNQVENFFEKPSAANNLISGGYFVFSKKLFSYLTTDENCDLEYGPLEKIAKKGELMVYRHPGYWACMDTYRDMKHLNNIWQKNKAGWKVW